jgi:hypothetical protein
MRPLNALQRALRTTIREPVVLVVAALLALLQVPVLLSQLLPPLLAAVASLGINLVVLVLVPFTQGGLLGLADGALDGRADVGTFLAEGREHYVSMLGAYLVLLGVSIVAGIATLVLLFVFGAGFGAAAAGLGGSGAAGSSAVGALGLAFAGVFALIGLVFLVVFLFVQFYAQAIVIDDYGAVASFKRSAGLVRNNFVSTLGYSVLAFLISGTIGAVTGVGSVLLTGDGMSALGIDASSLPLIAGLTVVIIVLSTLSSAVYSLYSVAFYRDISTA